MDAETGTKRIENLSYEGADGSVLRIDLDDGTSLLMDCDHPASDLALSIRDSPDPVDEEDLALLSRADAEFRCRRKAMDLLARSEQCRRGLDMKLKRKGWSASAVNTALNRLENSGLLDDRRFAETWLRSRLRSRPEGASRLTAGLMARGVSGGIAKAAVENVLLEYGDEDGSDALQRAWSKLSRRSGMNREKMTAALQRRGFRPAAIRSFLADMEQKSE